MLFFFVLAIVTIFLYHLAERSNNKQIYFIALLPPVLIEGLRNDNIGTDMNVYGAVWFYNMRVQDSLPGILQDATTPEYAYHSLIYLGKLLSKDIHVYLTLCAAIKMGLVFFTGYKFRHLINTSLFLAFYFSFFYFSGFSMMRQTLALSVCILSVWYLFNERYVVFLIIVFIAYLFHNSALLMLIVLYLYVTRKMKFSVVINLVGAVILYSSIPVLMEYLIGSSLFKEGVAEHYMDTGVVSAKTDMLFSITLLMYALYSFRKGMNAQKYMAFMCAVSTLVFLFLSNYIEVAFRMSYYFVIVSVPFSLALLRKEKPVYRRIGSLAFLFLMALQLYIGCVHGLNETLPYRSAILGI